VPLLPPDLAAYLGTVGEHVFPILLFLGLASRLSAHGLFAMTMVLQGGWPEHILWLSLLALIIARGPGAISTDHLIWNGRFLPFAWCSLDGLYGLRLDRYASRHRQPHGAVQDGVNGDRLHYLERESLILQKIEMAPALAGAICFGEVSYTE